MMKMIKKRNFVSRNAFIFFGMLLPVFVAGLPLWYGMGASIPSNDDLATAHGVLVVQQAVKNRKDGIRLESGEEIYFDCGAGGGCLSSEKRDIFTGMQADAWWYETPNYIFDWRQRYLIKLVINGDEIVSRDYSEARFKQWKRDGLFLFFGGLFFVFVIIRFFRD